MRSLRDSRAISNVFCIVFVALSFSVKFDNYEFIRLDALVMERLTSSPRIVDAYGHWKVPIHVVNGPKFSHGKNTLTK